MSESTQRTYADVCRDSAEELEGIRYCDGLGRPLPSAVAHYHAGDLRRLADLLDGITPELLDVLMCRNTTLSAHLAAETTAHRIFIALTSPLPEDR